jgi:hypothetical protein
MAVKTSWNAGDVLTAADLTDTFTAKASLAGATYTGTHDFTGATVTGISSGGLVLITSQSFSVASAVNVNNCFTSTYQTYRLIVDVSAASGVTLKMRMRASGTDATTNYSYAIYYGTKAAAAGNAEFASDNTFAETTAFAIGNMDATNGGGSLYDIENPQLARVTMISGWYNARGTGTLAGAMGGLHNTATAYDGFSIYPASGTITGTLRVYGYRNS